MNTFRTNLHALTTSPTAGSAMPAPTRDALIILGGLNARLAVETAEVGAGTCTFNVSSGGEELRMLPGHLAALGQQAAEVALLAGLPDDLAAPSVQRVTSIAWGDSRPFGALVVEATAGEETWVAGEDREITFTARTTHDTPVIIFSGTYTVALISKA